VQHELDKDGEEVVVETKAEKKKRKKAERARRKAERRAAKRERKGKKGEDDDLLSAHLVGETTFDKPEDILRPERIAKDQAETEFDFTMTEVSNRSGGMARYLEDDGVRIDAAIIWPDAGPTPPSSQASFAEGMELEFPPPSESEEDSDDVIVHEFFAGDDDVIVHALPDDGGGDEEDDDDVIVHALPDGEDDETEDDEEEDVIVHALPDDDDDDDVVVHGLDDDDIVVHELPDEDDGEIEAVGPGPVRQTQGLFRRIETHEFSQDDAPKLNFDAVMTGMAMPRPAIAPRSRHLREEELPEELEPSVEYVSESDLLLTFEQSSSNGDDSEVSARHPLDAMAGKEEEDGVLVWVVPDDAQL